MSLIADFAPKTLIIFRGFNMGQILAIASCRVSSPEQRQNGSLARQERSVIREAEKLNAKIIRT